MSVRIPLILLATALLLPAAAGGEEPEELVSEAPPAAQAAEVDEGAVCKVDDGATASAVVGRPEALARLQERLRAELAENDEPVIVLNNKGYGYQAPRQDPAQILRMLEREAALDR